MKFVESYKLTLLFSAILTLASAGTAEAATTNRALNTPMVIVGDNQNLGTIEILESIPGSFVSGIQIMILLPPDLWYNMAPSPATANNYIFIPSSTGSGVNALTLGDVIVNPASTNKTLLLDVVKVSNPRGQACIHILYNVPGYSQVNIDEGDFDRAVQIVEPNGVVTSGYITNSFSYGRTSAKVLDVPICNPGNGITLGTIKLEENRPGALLALKRSVSLTLPWGVTWIGAELKTAGGFLEGDVTLGDIDKDEDGNSRLWLDITRISVNGSEPYITPHITNNETGIIEIKGRVNIAPATKKGDINLHVGGLNPGIIPCNVVVAKNSGQLPVNVVTEHKEEKTQPKIEAQFIIGVASCRINNVASPMDIAPYIKEGRTFIPIYYVARVLGIEDRNILWDGLSQTLILIKDAQVARLAIGNSEMVLKDGTVKLEAAPELNSGRTCLPIGPVVQAFGKKVIWEPSSYTLTII